ncbi:hypothetical protein, variant 1 [Aphanomyces invadans]|uniref:Alpha-N-acetylglucosaminidase n=1 Tax=Aphanomyces invadans TaxID=157072 RepID=A0A024UQP6_9STRA|nr:hypothetical protein, variant 1 [Aphanomyces invadans]ETW08490.1 hypothetical protein, variant 1 [Aphanomyces invadans]|eukprot:XP_008862295.1 hypothetical protein, variant 1 [Aphanomyces invadans]
MLRQTMWQMLGAMCTLSLVAHAMLDVPSHDAVAAVKGLVARRLGEKYLDQMSFEVIPAIDDGKDVLEIGNDGGKVQIRGSSGTALAYAVQWYLKQEVHTQTNWDDHVLQLPDTLPQPSSTVRVEKVSKYTYYQNVCTVSYSMWTWGWDKWEKHIDWMALNGINMPLAFTGQEKVWQATYQKFNVSTVGLNKFFAGASFLAWGRMGNVRGSWVKGPLAQEFIDGQFELQVKILTRMRDFGMIPALPAFAGHIPEEITKLYPHAKTFRSPKWGNFPDAYTNVYMLDSSDPLYIEIGRTFIEEQTRLHGGFTSSLYQADTYNEMDPSRGDHEFLHQASKAVIDSMTKADPKAVWLIQAWTFNRGFWGHDQIQSYLSGVPNDKMILLDLYSETIPIWPRSANFFGKSWIYCLLHNFGGNTGLRGNLPQYAQEPIHARGQSNGTMVGIGLTMEGIFQNYIVYDLTLQMAWESKPVDLAKWLPAFVRNRYHIENTNAAQAWHMLLQSVYNVGDGGGVTKSIVAVRPGWDILHLTFQPTDIPYDPRLVVTAWSHLLAAADAVPHTDAFLHDVVDVTRQVLCDLFLANFKEIKRAFIGHNITTEEFADRTRCMLQLLWDLDVILGSHVDFLLGRWIDQARALAGNNTNVAEYLEYEARNQITRWGDSNGNYLSDYAAKDWAGLMSSYYYPRWRIWLTEVTAAYESHRDIHTKAVNDALEAFELGWQLETVSFPTTAHGDPVQIARRLQSRHADRLARVHVDVPLHRVQRHEPVFGQHFMLDQRRSKTHRDMDDCGLDCVA